MADSEGEERAGPPARRLRAPGGRTILRGASAAILRALATGAKNVTELVTLTGLAQSNVSNHLARLRERDLVSSHREGRQIIYRLASPAVSHFVASAGNWQPQQPLSAEQVAEEFLRAVLTLREEEPAQVVDRALAEGMAWKEMYLGVFVPTLQRIGEMWERDELSVASEHLITGIVVRLLHRLSLKLPACPEASAPSALVGCVEGELHTVGGRMVADFLIAHGWRIWYLNGLLPLEHLMDAVGRHLPDAVVLCISTVEQRPSLESSVRRFLRWRGEQPLPLLVAGGRFFYTEPPVEGLDIWGTDIEEVTTEMNRRVAQVRSLAC